MRLDVVTIFPEYLAPLSLSLVGKAVEAGIVELDVHDLRTWTDDRHRTVDDAPYGGGAGMVMAAEPWGRALESIAATGVQGARPHLLVTSPSGRPLTQAWAAELAREPWLVVACGRYEGIDARVVEDAAEHMRVDEVSVGDVVLAGGDAAALVIAEAVVRLLPGVLGKPSSLEEESHVDGVLEYPVYTRPSVWRGRPVPDVLLSGNHGRIARWRREQSIRRTSARRPDLIESILPGTLGEADVALLRQLGWTFGPDGRFRRPPQAVAH
jgi:tRNA (guanine37-N1)-methyltransferase